ncbi:MAG: hypothetical protein ACRENJ_10590, partial [Candidatus Eiseniibacteriota bacterium]
MLEAVIVLFLLQSGAPSAPPIPPDTTASRADTTRLAPPDTTASRADTTRLAPPDTTVPRADTTLAPPDTTARRVVRQFPAVEVRALLNDARTSQTVRQIPVAALRVHPADRLADLVALQPGVVADGDELHVRGGRAGETRVILEGVTLNEPLRHRPMELPLLALRGAELVSGAPESRHAGALAGVLDLHTV